jgi:hypothetical protein
MIASSLLAANGFDVSDLQGGYDAWAALICGRASA